MRAILVGGGVGGLASAVGLKRVGLDVTLIEQAPALAEVGAGINLWPNAMKALTALGVDKRIREHGIHGTTVAHADLTSGTELEVIDFRKAEPVYRDGLYNSHRADLLDAIAAELQGIEVLLGERVIAVHDEGDQVCVQLRSGESHSGDLIVAADGIGSQIRQQLFGDDDFQNTYVSAWRTLVPLSALAELPEIGGVRTWFGPGHTVSAYRVRKDLLSLSAYVPSSEIPPESWLSAGDLSALQGSFQSACAEVQYLIGAVENAFVTPVRFRNPIETWSVGRIVLLGDAAHPIPPFAGQGAGLALEDAVALASVLRDCARADVATALETYGRIRFPRAQRVLGLSRANLRDFRESDPIQAAARDGRLHGLRRLDPLRTATSGWLYGYEPVAAVDAHRAAGPDTGAAPTAQTDDAGQRARLSYQSVFSPEERANGWRAERLAYRNFRASLPSAPHAVVEWSAFAGLDIRPPTALDGLVVLHLHGCGYVWGSPEAAVSLAGRLAAAAGARVVVPQYPLAPEHAFPMALSAIRDAYAALSNELGRGTKIVVTGDCSGGGLALSLTASLRDDGYALPDALHLMSPFCDLTLTSDSIDGNTSDPWHDRASLTSLAASYLHDADPADPRVSPMLGDMRELPPMLIQIGAGEALAGDGRRVAAAIRAAGGNAVLEEYETSIHSFPLFRDLPQTMGAMSSFEQFCQALRLDSSTPRGPGEAKGVE